MFFIFDNYDCKISKENKNGKLVGEIGNIKIVTNRMVLKSAKKKENITKLYPLLKSNLQKQIRRGEKEAVVTAEMMLDINDFELLRRLSVIALEDVEMTYETATIVWFMCAVSKGYVLSIQDKNYILSYVNNLVYHPNFSYFSHDEDDTQNMKCDKEIEKILDSDHQDKEYIAAILFRASFGGLKGDVLMINTLCKKMVREGERLKHLENREIEKDLKLKINDAAIDFHIYPQLLNLISKDTGINEEVIKSVIWHCSSKTNYRNISSDHVLKEYNDIWSKISKSFNYHTKTYLSGIVKTYF